MIRVYRGIRFALCCYLLSKGISKSQDHTCERGLVEDIVD